MAIRSFFLLVIFVFSSFSAEKGERKNALHFPYAAQGLTERQAAAHLLSRFSYGARPGDIDQVLKVGLESWFEKQLRADLPDDYVAMRLKNFDALRLSNAEIANTYLRHGQILKMAIADGKMNPDSVHNNDRKRDRMELESYMKEKGLKSERELIRQFASAKFIRSIYSENQLQEVMTEFWFNHFNVSFTKGICVPFIPSYERDVIRPHAVGNFGTLLVASAQSPAMLLYLDNFISSSEDSNTGKPHADRKMKGINENYAREVMELHTLGVDGGYTQRDVTEAARVLTGWTIYPMGRSGYGSGLKHAVQKIGEQNLAQRGFVRRGDFLFVPGRHDQHEKTVLGKKFDKQAGYEEGVQLLGLLSTHPSTATFISKKIATRFVNDDPDEKLVAKMAGTFSKTGGDIREVLLTLVSSPEFWSSASVRAKTKSPFELVVSAVRALGADVHQPFQLFNWTDRLGQRMYFYPSPTGFPDKAQHWINTGALLNRMTFGLALADGKIAGVKFNLLALNGNHEPEHGAQALLTYSTLLMPERPMEQTVQSVTPLLNDPNLQQKVYDAASEQHNGQGGRIDSLSDASEVVHATVPADAYTGYRLSQIVGILIGSPEFQRR